MRLCQRKHVYLGACERGAGRGKEKKRVIFNILFSQLTQPLYTVTDTHKETQAHLKRSREATSNAPTAREGRKLRER